jgi:hypothetical protein
VLYPAELRALGKGRFYFIPAQVDDELEALVVFSLLRPPFFCRSPHLRARRRRHTALLAPHRHLGRMSRRYLHSLRLDFRPPPELAPVFARELSDQLTGLAANEMKRFEHRISLLKPLSRMRLGGAKQPADFGCNLFQTRCSSLSQGNLQMFRYYSFGEIRRVDATLTVTK